MRGLNLIGSRQIRDCPRQLRHAMKGTLTTRAGAHQYGWQGARLPHTLDRKSERYQQLYRERTAVERINTQAVATGIERPHLRHGPAITNQNTMIYLLINLRFLQRLRDEHAENL